eukprot:5420841-Alexandrium_andersonii.AAC.1
MRKLAQRKQQAQLRQRGTAAATAAQQQHGGQPRRHNMQLWSLQLVRAHSHGAGFSSSSRLSS